MRVLESEKTERESGQSRARVTAGALLVLGFVAVSLNSRVAFGQVGPLAPVAGFTSSAVMVLGVIPPLLMGLFAPLTPTVRRRLGDERALVLASLVLLAGAVVRPWSMAWLVVGTAVAASATAIINVLIPVLVQSRFSSASTGLMMGVYAVCMGLGSAIIAAITVPITRATGSWHIAVAVGVVPAAIAALAIAPQWRNRAPVAAGEPERHQVHRTHVAWSLMCFFGIQTLLFYAVIAFLPSIVVAGGVSAATAGIVQSLYIVGIGLGGFVFPAVAGRHPVHIRHILAVIGLSAIGVVGLLVVRGPAVGVIAVILGAALGGGQSLPGVLFAHRGKVPERIVALSTFAQTGGYLIAATGPVLMWVLHQSTHSWTAPLVVLLVLLGGNAVVGVRAGHDDERWFGGVRAR